MSSARVLRATAEEMEGHRPFGVWLDALRPATAAEPGPDVVAAPTEPEPASTESLSAARFRTEESLLTVIERRAARQPLVVVLEDLHWADLASLALVHRLARIVARGGTEAETPSVLACVVEDPGHAATGGGAGPSAPVPASSNTLPTPAPPAGAPDSLTAPKDGTAGRPDAEQAPRLLAPPVGLSRATFAVPGGIAGLLVLSLLVALWFVLRRRKRTEQSHQAG